MVKVPALTEDGQNWKIYRAKLLEHAATKGWLNVLAGKPDEDWEGCNALLHELLHDTIPISIYIRLHRNTMHQAFKHLAKRFRDCEPIADPRAKKLATCANEAKRHLSAEAPTSENAATERHAHAEREDLPCTKDLTRGTSAESANGTTVLLTGEPHETQNEPQDSLPLTLRLPTEGKPDECKQEVAESVVTAGRTNGTVGMTEPHETDADVDGTAALGGEPAERVQGVGEGDETERDGQSRLQQIEFYCKEDRQHEENANVPNARGALLEGEWAVCASGESRESKGCERDTSKGASVDELETPAECCQQLCMAHGDPGRGIEPADTPNESETLVIVSIASESPDGGGIPRVHLGGTRSRAGDANGCGNRADASRGSTDALSALNNAEMAGMSDGEGAGTYLGVGDAKCVVNTMDGVGSRTDASTGPTDVPCVATHANIPANATQIVSIPQKKAKPPDSPFGTTRTAPDEPNGVGDHTDGSSRCTDVHSIGNGRETAENDSRSVRKRQTEAQTRNSPKAHEIATPEPTKQWTRVSIGGGDVYVPFNAPIAIPTRRIVFGRPESGDEAIAPSVEGERAGEGDGGGYGGDGDMGDTTSGGNSDSIRVEAALLAGESQRVRYSRRTRTGNLPVSSWPPVQHERRPYGSIRRRPRHGRLKIERINISQTPERETTYLGRAHVTQPPGNTSNQAYGVYRPRCRRGRIKSAPTNVSRTRNGGNAYLRRDNAIRLIRRPRKQIRRLNKLTFDCRMQGERRCDLPNRATTRKSHKRTNLRIHKSQILFESDTFICKHILLHSAKYIH